MSRIFHFLDSGAFTLWTKAARYAKKEKTQRWAYYDTDEFWRYVDNYAEFVKKYKDGIDLYANIDVIPNPELTWRNQRYLEKKGLRPVPVVHFPTDLKWLKHYRDRDYPIIGLGGLVGRTQRATKWIDDCFSMVCPPPARLPTTKLHGFGIVNYRLLIRYPWFSVDSAAWAKEAGRWGCIFVPHKRNGSFIFTEDPYKVLIAHTTAKAKSVMDKDSANVPSYFRLSEREKRIVHEWLGTIDVPLGKINEHWEPEEFGVLTRNRERIIANILFFDRMSKSLPKYPWAFKSQNRELAI